MRIQSIILLTIIAFVCYVKCDEEEVLTEIEHKGILYSEFKKKADEYEAYRKLNGEMEKSRDERSVFGEEEFEDCDEDELNFYEKDSEDGREEEEEDNDDGDEEDLFDDPYIFSSADLEYLDKD